MMLLWRTYFSLWYRTYRRACFKVRWCTKCAVMNRNVQWWKAVCAVTKRSFENLAG